jgi:hypothetical protein
MIELPLDLIQRLLSFQYVDDSGYGYIKCRSCGAKGFHDYDLNKIDRESCSKNCPFFRLEKLMLDSQDYKESINDKNLI